MELNKLNIRFNLFCVIIHLIQFMKLNILLYLYNLIFYLINLM